MLINCLFFRNPLQCDVDKDGKGNECDEDIDNDGKLNNFDNCILVTDLYINQYWQNENTFKQCDIKVANVDQADKDGDRVGDACDNCPSTPNTNQDDVNDNRIGKYLSVLLFPCKFLLQRLTQIIYYLQEMRVIVAPTQIEMVIQILLTTVL